MTEGAYNSKGLLPNSNKRRWGHNNNMTVIMPWWVLKTPESDSLKDTMKKGTNFMYVNW